MMSSRVLPVLLACTALPFVPAQAADKLPAIKASAKNAVPACATPGRMQALLRARNPNLDARFDAIATEYMRHGEQIGIRWDFAFYQMIVETGALTFRNGDRAGSVKPSQNNFAGLGATGKGEPGESFKDVASGVRAHLQHLQMYSGERVTDPVADRTRKVQEWGVLTSWQSRFSRPITFSDLAAKWAPGSRSYGDMLDAVADQFDDICKRPDPRPELVAEARRGTAVAEARIKERTAKAEPREEPAERISGAELARKAVEEARAEGNATRTGLGVTVPRKEAAPSAPLTVLNAPKAPEADAGTVQTAAAAAAAVMPAAPTPPATASASKCRVFTASYGGLKSVIIKAGASDGTNYTVLDVNEGAEKRETDAFISAYAKGGQMIGEFGNQNAALDKAFELCPEG